MSELVDRLKEFAIESKHEQEAVQGSIFDYLNEEKEEVAIESELDLSPGRTVYMKHGL